MNCLQFEIGKAYRDKYGRCFEILGGKGNKFDILTLNDKVRHLSVTFSLVAQFEELTTNEALTLKLQGL